jgi:hypothetical protein
MHGGCLKTTRRHASSPNSISIIYQLICVMAATSRPHCLARYTAAVAEAWARSKGATDAEIQIARGCIKPQLTAQLNHVID